MKHVLYKREIEDCNFRVHKVTPKKKLHTHHYKRMKNLQTHYKKHHTKKTHNFRVSQNDTKKNTRKDIVS